MRHRTLLAALLPVLLLAAEPARAEAPQPKWEAGLALAGYSYPDWRGADHRNTSFLPLPYLIYRGDRVRLARSGLKVRIFDSERVSLNIAAAFALAGDAATHPARAGMRRLLPPSPTGPLPHRTRRNRSPKPWAGSPRKALSVW